MRETVDLLIEDPRWQTIGLEEISQAAVDATLRHLRLDPEAFELSLMGCDDARIRALNVEFREKDKATNVLSWPSEERASEQRGAMPELPQTGGGPFAEELGDIAIAYETCVREAEELGRSTTDHVTHLIVHGVLHLLGFDHIDDKDAALMEGLEREILEILGISDPYRITD